jgi:hypothetical protein
MQILILKMILTLAKSPDDDGNFTPVEIGAI